MSNASPILDRAYDLIEKGQLPEARALLDSLMPEHENDPDVWWLMANASEDSNEGRLALDRVIALNPDYPGAKDLLKEATVNNTADLVAKDAKKPRIPIQLLSLIVLLLLGVAIILFLIVNSGSPTPPQVADNPTIEPSDAVQTVDGTPTLDVIPFENATSTDIFSVDATVTNETFLGLDSTPTTNSVDDATPTLENVNTVASEDPILEFTAQSVELDATPTFESVISSNPYAFLETFDIPENGITTTNDTLSISLCAVVGTEAGNAIRELIVAIALNVSVLDTNIATVAVSVIDCFDTGNEQRTVSVPTDAIRAYADGSIDLQALQQSIQPIR